MKTRAPSHSSHGVALLLVLAFIVLLAGLMLAFFFTATSAVRSAGSHRDGVAVQQLADAAVNVVMGQVADGTHTAKQGAAEDGLVWTSQPGLIRTYGTDGMPYRFYKLYSSANMVVRNFDGGYWSPEENVTREVPADWFEQRGLFTDLNEPVLVPLEASTVTSDDAPPKGAIRVAGRWHYANYPILDPAAQARKPGPKEDPAEVKREGVEGFAIDAERVSGAPSSPPPDDYNPTLVINPRRSPNPAPMPVRWLYVLRDGRLTLPERSERGAGGTQEMHWTPGSPDAPTQANPIVGRIAFWADDETCKLNINTASEGMFWDRPCCIYYGSRGYESQGGLNFAELIPRHDEWQRIPGHPAMTCLSPVFGMLPDFRVPLGKAITGPDFSKFAAYYRLLPRLGAAGTSAGLCYSIDKSPGEDAESNRDRLFASVDELLFTPNSLPLAEGAAVALREQPKTEVPRYFLEKAKFFLTTANRAPETNMFNRPRIGLWSLQQERDPNRGHAGCPDRPRTPMDDLIAQCLTVGGKPYFLQRYSVYMDGTVNDRAQHPDVPFGQQGNLVPPSSQSRDLDWKIERNRQLYRYLQDLTSRPIPGLSARRTLLAKYGADRNPLLTSMVDLVRTVNSETPDNFRTNKPPAYSYSPPHDALHLFDGPGAGQVVPLIPPPGTPGAGTKGFGRFPTVVEVGVMFFRVGASSIAAELLIQPFYPSASAPGTTPLIRYTVRGLGQFWLNGQSLNMPNIATMLVNPAVPCDHSLHPFHCLHTQGNRWAPWGPQGPTTRAWKTLEEGGNEEEHYPFFSRDLVTLPARDGTMSFRGGKIIVEVYAGYDGAIRGVYAEPSRDTLVQTLHFDFPDCICPIPSRTSWQTMAEVPASYIPHGNQVVVRSVQVNPDGPTHGDLRLVAAPQDVPDTYFHPHPDYHSATLPNAHSFRNGDDYIDGASLSVSLRPGKMNWRDVGATGLEGAFLAGTKWLGDWNNGPGEYGDGAQIQPPDVGNANSYAGGYGTNRGAQFSFRADFGETYSPLREVPSPVIFGSLPVGTRVADPQPWRTLLFCPNPASGKNHPGWQQPRDHYFLDLFQMPVVEPYGLSEPLSTAGKVNLNCQLVPFTYIQRDTALRGALRATKISAIRERQFDDWPADPQRLTIDADETLKGFQRRFADKGGCFKTASELCEMFLVPEGAKLKDMAEGDPARWWWKDYECTGDNLRENPYGHLYSRVTARSNTFTVHYRVQVLGHNAAAHPNVWIEGADPVLREARGSTMIERYIDANDPRLGDFATDRNATLDECYKFRVLRVQRFGR